MTHENREDREELALDALIASFFHISPGDELIPLDDPAILSDEDREELATLGDDLVQRLLAKSRQAEPPPASVPVPHCPDFAVASAAPEFFAMHRGDEPLTSQAEDELERRRRELLEEDDECEE